ncbi:hypothetical protein [Geofilum rubicundum]|nr:hypothetical protein [Geofilum rubicundum]
MLDREKLANDIVFWQWLNLLAPVLFLVLIGLVFTLWRKMKYGREASRD